MVEVFVRDSATMRIDTAPGQEQDEEDRYVTVVVKDFMTEEEIASAAVALDGAAKGATGEGGSLDLGLIPGGEHSIRVTKTGYKPTSDPDDGLENDTIRIAKTTYVTTEEEETTDPNIITVHDDLANIKGDGTYHISYSQQQRLPPWGGNEDEVLILGPSGYPVSSGKSLAGKSDVGHTHEESDIIDLKNYLDLNNPSSLGSDWDIGNGRKIQGDKLQERSDEGGVEIVDTGNLGIKVAHGGVLTLDRALDTRSLFTRFESYDGWTEACTDTGSVPTKELAKMVLSTGVNNGSTAEMYITETPFVSVWDDSHFYGWICRYDTTPGNEEIYLLVTQDTGIATNKERAGFKIVDGRIWALSGNEIDEELTNTGYDLSKNQSIQLHILILEDNVFQFYLNNVLYATHEAYTLNGFNTRFVCYIKNTAAADARLRIMQAFYFHKWF